MDRTNILSELIKMRKPSTASYKKENFREHDIMHNDVNLIMITFSVIQRS